MEGGSGHSMNWPLAVAGAVGMSVGAALALLCTRHQASTEVPHEACTPAAGGGKQPLNEFDTEHFARAISFLGEEDFEKLRESFIVVVGLGGVGSHAAHMLARSGVRRMRVVDFDLVTLSSLNRHAVATRADVGVSKADVLKNHLKDIVPTCEVEACTVMFSDTKADELLGGNPAFVLDCIDNTDTKIQLLAYCQKRNIPVVASAGAGGRIDPSCIQVAPVSETRADPLARTVRQRLKQEGVDARKIPMVYTTEVPPTKSLVYNPGDTEAALDEYQILPGFRVGIIPVLGFIPAMFGNAMAAYVVAKITGRWPEEQQKQKRTKKYFSQLLGNLKNREHSTFGVPSEELKAIPIAAEDTEHLFEHVWLSRSALSKQTKKLCFTRWDRSQPATPSNLILLTGAEAREHDALPGETAASEAALVERYASALPAIRTMLQAAADYQASKSA